MDSLVKFAGKIEAIKALRTMCDKAAEEPFIHRDGGNVILTFPKRPSLKELKDIVEAIMALSETTPYVWELVRKSAMDGAISITPERIGVFKSELDATNCMNNIMRVKGFNEVYETSYDYMITKLSIRTGYDGQ